MSNLVCSYCIVGYCKEKNACSKIHTIDDCQLKYQKKTVLGDIGGYAGINIVVFTTNPSSVNSFLKKEIY